MSNNPTCPYCGFPEERRTDTRHQWFSCETYLRRSDGKTVWQSELCQTNQQISESWEIINVLTMMDIDRQEPWPRALEWLALNEGHRKSQTITGKVADSWPQSPTVGGAEA